MKNPSAFPTGIITDGKGKIIGGSNGMTLRDYFAAKAMPVSITEYATFVRSKTPQIWDAEWRKLVAEDAYKIADAMLAAREEA